MRRGNEASPRRGVRLGGGADLRGATALEADARHAFCPRLAGLGTISTERALLLELLDLERRRQVEVLAALPVATVVTDTRGRVIESNAAFKRLWSAPPKPDDLNDLRNFKAWPPGARRDASTFDWRLARVLATGQPVIEEELEIESFDGVCRTVLSSAFPTRDARGEPSGAVGVQVEITERARAQRARQILSEATAALIESLDPTVTLRTLSRIVVTYLADCCAIDEVDERGELRRLVAETSGAPTADEAAKLLALVPAASGNSLAARALKSRKPLLVSDVPADWLATGPEADEHRTAFANIGAYSLMVLPLIASGHSLGVLGIISTRRDRRYDARDLALAEEISRRAAIALYNARLHRRAESAVQARDKLLAEFEACSNASPVAFAVLDRQMRLQSRNVVVAAWQQRGADVIPGRALEDVIPSALDQLEPPLRLVLVTGRAVIDRAIDYEWPVFPKGSGMTRRIARPARKDQALPR